MRKNELLSFSETIEALHVGDDSVYLHRGQVLLLLDLETSLALNQAKLVSQVLILYGDLKVCGQSLFMLLLQPKQVLSEL